MAEATHAEVPTQPNLKISEIEFKIFAQLNSFFEERKKPEKVFSLVSSLDCVFSVKFVTPEQNATIQITVKQTIFGEEVRPYGPFSYFTQTIRLSLIIE